MQNANTAAPAGSPQLTGWCLDKEDLSDAQLAGLREQDRDFVAALLEANLVEPDLIAERLPTVPPEDAAAIEHALTWLASTR